MRAEHRYASGTAADPILRELEHEDAVEESAPFAVTAEACPQAAHGVVEELEPLLLAGGLGHRDGGFARPQRVEYEPAPERHHTE